LESDNSEKSVFSAFSAFFRNPKKAEKTLFWNPRILKKVFFLVFLLFYDLCKNDMSGCVFNFYAVEHVLSGLRALCGFMLVA